MAQNPMVAEVNRLIANLLASGEQIAFPQVGTLKPVTRPSRKVSRRKAIPPLHEVEYTSEVQGETLPARLVKAAGCTNEQAEDIYSRWLAQTWQQGVLTLEGIGVLKEKSFVLDPDFESRLNPQGRQPILLRRRRHGFDWTMALGLVAIVAAVAIGWFGYRQLSGSMRMPWEKEPAATTTTTAVTTEQTTDAAPAAAETTTTAHPATQAATTSQTSGTQTQSTPAAAAQGAVPTSPTAEPSIERMTSGHYYVVMGVFSTPENARRAVREAAKRDASVACRIYYFGQKWMVSPFTAADAAEADAFRKRNAATFADMWVYRAR